MTATDPFGDEPIPEIVLARAPLIRALAQIQFDQIADMLPNAFVPTIQRVAQLLKDSYPVIRQEQEFIFNVNFGPDPQQMIGPGGQLFRLQDDALAWTVTFGPQMVAIDTTRYVTRADLVSRLEVVLRALTEVVRIPAATRVGMRHTNRIAGSDRVTPDRLASLFSPTVLGPLTEPNNTPRHVQHTITETVFNFGATRRLHARAGFIPAHVRFDISIEPVPEVSYFLDLDCFDDGRIQWDLPRVLSVADELSLASYRYFRSVVTKKFDVEFGASA